MTETCLATKVAAMPLTVKAGDAPGVFEGYGAVFGNRDRDGDVVSQGAFAESLKGGMPALLWQHDQKSPIGKFEDVREDDKGLYVKGRLSMTGRGAEAYDLLKMGALNGLSIGFVTKEATRDPATSTRTITKADLMEVSLVTFPANDMARVTGVKSAFSDAQDSERAFERLLRDNGFSRSLAKAITAKGFRASNLEAFETADIAAMIDTLKASQRRLEAKGGRSEILSGVASGIAQGVTEQMLARGLDAKDFRDADRFLKDMEADGRRGKSSHHISLEAGRGKNLEFPLDYKRGSRTFSVLMSPKEAGAGHRYSIILRYPQWTSDSVKVHKLMYDKLTYNGRFREDVKVGQEQMIAKWLASVTSNKLRQAKSELNGYPSPRAWIMYHGSKNGATSAEFEVSLV